MLKQQNKLRRCHGIRSIDLEEYKDMFNELLIEEANALYPDGWFFKQDNARPHVSA